MTNLGSLSPEIRVTEDIVIARYVGLFSYDVWVNSLAEKKKEDM